jgi:predicted permease
MISLRILFYRLRALFLKRNLEQELDEEIRSHLEMQSEDLQRQGMSAAEARYAALRKFGGIDQVKERYRDKRSLPIIETLFRDLRYGLRMLRRAPVTTAVAVLSLALGIGANTALFSAVDAVLLKKLPVEAPDRLVVFEWQAGRRFRTNGMSGTSNVSAPPDSKGLSLFRPDVFAKMDDARRAQSVSPLSDLFAFGPIGKITALLGEQAELINGQAVSGGYYTGLKAQPILGRAITDEDDRPGAPPVVVLSNRFWSERFGANSAIIGQQLKLNKQSFTIIGVDPPSFTGTSQVDYHPAVTIPLAHEPLLLGDSTKMGTATEPGIWWLNLMGRLRPGASFDQARESLNGAFQAAALEVMPPPRKENEPTQLDSKDHPHLLTESGSRGMPDMRKVYAPTIYGLFILVGVVLLIACTNLANLLLARAAVRGPEISVRLAVGTGRWRIVRQLLTESLLLATIGGVMGVLLAFWGKSVLVAFTDKDAGLLPNGVDFGVSWRVLAFTFVVSLLTGFMFGIIPAWRATNLDLATALKQSRRTTSSVSRVSKTLLVLQVALSSLLLVGAALFTNTLYNLERVNVGFNQQNLLLFTLQPDQAGYKDEKLVRFYQRLCDRLDHLPSVHSATFASVQLLANDNWFNDFMLPGETEQTAAEHVTMRQLMRENYFTTMEIPFLRGRQFTVQDDQHAPNVAIVNETFVRQFFPNQNALGQRIRFNDKEGKVEIVGVVADAKYESQREENKPVLYTPWQQETSAIGRMHFAVRTASEPVTLAGTVRQLLHELDGNLPVTEVGTQFARAQSTIGQERLYARLLGFFGAVALLLAAIGLFGVLAHSVSQRTKEIGIRMAFGAPINSVLRLVIWEGMRLVLLGLAFGALTGYALNRLVETRYFAADGWERRMTEQLYGVKITDPFSLIVAGLLLTLVAFVACWLPARRATRVDPLVALRYE